MRKSRRVRFGGITYMNIPGSEIGRVEPKRRKVAQHPETQPMESSEDENILGSCSSDSEEFLKLKSDLALQLSTLGIPLHVAPVAVLALSNHWTPHLMVEEIVQTKTLLVRTTRVSI